MSKNGGPAFPVVAENGLGHVSNGVSMRDYFAAKAPPPPKWWTDCYAKNEKSLGPSADTIAQWNYVYADAMLKERER